MSQLIALIIAIALGAIVTAIGYVFLGDAFTKNSEKGIALQFINQASQIEMGMTAYRTENAKTAFDTDWATSQTALETAGYIKSGLKAPIGSYDMYQTSGDVLLVVDEVVATGISEDICKAIVKIADYLPSAGSSDTDTDTIFTPTTDITDGATAKTALDGGRFNCFEDVDGTDNATKYIFAYEVE